MIITTSLEAVAQALPGPGGRSRYNWNRAVAGDLLRVQVR